MAKNAISKTFVLPVQWNGRRYSESSDVPAVTAPSGLSATPSGTTINLSWTNGEATAYTIVERSNNGSGGWITIATKNPGVTSHSNTSLAAGTYYYRVSHSINGATSSVSSNASGTVASGGSTADGDSVTVTIPSGGSNVAASAQAFLGGYNGTVESGTVGNLFNTNMPTSWAQPGGSGPRFTSTRTLNGTKALVNDTAGGAYQFGFRYDHGASQRVQFCRFSYYFDNPNGSTGQLKFVRFVGDITSTGGLADTNQPNHYITFFDPDDDTPGSGTYMPVNNSTLGGSNVNRQETSVTPGATDGYYAEGVWVTIEIYSLHNSDVTLSDGEVRLVAKREDTGAVIADYIWENQRLDYGGSDRGRWLVFQFYLGNGLADGSAKVYIDRDVYVSSNQSAATPPKFILLGDASTYAACTKFTVCEFTAWTDNAGDAEVTFRANQGYHASLSGLYVYGMSGPNTPINTTGVVLP